MVSVIIPAYNAAKTIGKTLDSVFAQTYVQIEIIVIDDGSTDETASILSTYKDKVKVVKIENKGVSHARNLGLSKANGKYIQFLDADDLLLPEKIGLQVKALEENNAEIAYGNWQRFTEVDDEILIKKTITNKLNDDIELDLFTDFWCPPAVLLYSKKITDQLKWNENLPVIQDARYLLDAAIAKGKFVFVPELMAQYRDSQQESLSKRNELAFVTDCFTNAKEISQVWINDFDKNPLKKKAIIGVLRHAINRLSVLDKRTAKQAIDFLLEIEPNYIPEERGLLRYLSKLIGYKNAELIAGLKRKFIK
jgi:glycosyltransferase involved in cell wall biosynthesis